MSKDVFYKGVLKSDLKNNYIPGTVTKNVKEALMWCERIQSNKTKGAARNVRHGASVIIEIKYPEDSLLSHTEFQREGVKEHERNNCWLNQVKSKAQINTPIKTFKILSKEDLDNFTLI